MRKGQLEAALVGREGYWHHAAQLLGWDLISVAVSEFLLSSVDSLL